MRSRSDDTNLGYMSISISSKFSTHRGTTSFRGRVQRFGAQQDSSAWKKYRSRPTCPLVPVTDYITCDHCRLPVRMSPSGR